MMMSTLTVLQQASGSKAIKPVLIASFGNLDLLKYFSNIIEEIKLAGNLNRKRVKKQLLEDFSRCCIKLEPCPIAV
jgi:hypothetical protein